MKIATWNINGVKARLDTALAWLREARPDVVCLQEIKSVDEGFPVGAFQDAGYNIATHGQKGFNGVAILSLAPIEVERRGLPGDELLVRRLGRGNEPAFATGPRLAAIETAVDENPREPDFERQFLAERAQVHVRLDERILHRLVRVCGIPQIVEGDAKRPPLVARDQLAVHDHVRAGCAQVEGRARQDQRAAGNGRAR